MPEVHGAKVPPTLTPAGIEELHAALDRAEADPAAKVVVLEGEGGTFSNGMDFEAMLAGASPSELARFPALLRRFATTRRVVIAAVDGKVQAGGMGLCAAADLVYATERSTFTLPEALWGLLPCVIAPWLVRRAGFQKAYELTLTTRTMSAKEAQEVRLVDALVSDLPAHLAVQSKRLSRLEAETIGDAKAYFAGLSGVNAGVEAAALAELNRLLGSERVRRNIESYARYGRLPWESW